MFKLPQLNQVIAGIANKLNDASLTLVLYHMSPYHVLFCILMYSHLFTEYGANSTNKPNTNLIHVRLSSSHRNSYQHQPTTNWQLYRTCLFSLNENGLESVFKVVIIKALFKIFYVLSDHVCIFQFFVM